MTIAITLAGATGWVGKALVQAIAAAPDLRLASAVSRNYAGRDAGEVAGIAALGVPCRATLAEALETPSDVMIDYTKPDVVKHHVLAALAHGRHVVVGTSGMSADDYAKIDVAAGQAGKGVLAAGNFSITATLLRRFALEAARYVPDVEVIDYASAKKPDTPSGTGRELGELLSEVRLAPTSRPVAELGGVRETRGGAIGAAIPVQVHSVRMPSFVLSCEAIFGAPDERLVIRHDAGSSAAPYVAGTLLAARKVGASPGSGAGSTTSWGIEPPQRKAGVIHVRQPRIAIDASMKEIAAFQPASDSPRMRKGASVQLMIRVRLSCASRSLALAGPRFTAPAQSAGPAHHPHSTPAWCTPSATLTMKMEASIAKAGRAARGILRGPVMSHAKAASGMAA